MFVVFSVSGVILDVFTVTLELSLFSFINFHLDLVLAAAQGCKVV